MRRDAPPAAAGATQARSGMCHRYRWCTCAHSMVHAARCTLHAALSMLHAARCMLHVARCLLHVICCLLYVVCCLLHVAYCKLHAARRMLQSHAACSHMRVAHGGIGGANGIAREAQEPRVARASLPRTTRRRRIAAAWPATGCARGVRNGACCTRHAARRQ